MVVVLFVILHGNQNLKEHLENKIKSLKEASENLQRMEYLSENLILKINHAIGTLNEILKSTGILELTEEQEIFGGLDSTI